MRAREQTGNEKDSVSTNTTMYGAESCTLINKWKSIITASEMKYRRKSMGNVIGKRANN